MQRNKYYYHVTTQDRLPAILEKGLQPMIGENSVNAGENVPAIYLSPPKSVPHWFILTHADTVLRIDPKGLDLPLKAWQYGDEPNYYHELRTSRPIAPEWISVYRKPDARHLANAMKSLADGYVYALSHLCYSALRLERMLMDDRLSGMDADVILDDAACIAGAITSNLKIMSGIDFSTLSQKEIAKSVRDYSNEACYVTFADSYYNKNINPDIPDAGKRCWQHLANVQVEVLKGPCRELNRFIRKTIPPYVRWLPGIGGFAM